MTDRRRERTDRRTGRMMEGQGPRTEGREGLRDGWTEGWMGGREEGWTNRKR